MVIARRFYADPALIRLSETSETRLNFSAVWVGLECLTGRCPREEITCRKSSLTAQAISLAAILLLAAVYSAGQSKSGPRPDLPYFDWNA
jgi:hypothetical protein